VRDADDGAGQSPFDIQRMPRTTALSFNGRPSRHVDQASRHLFASRSDEFTHPDSDVNKQFSSMQYDVALDSQQKAYVVEQQPSWIVR
jgi:hypothetical protein